MKVPAPVGRLFTNFTRACSFRLPTQQPYVLTCKGFKAAIVLERELAPVEFIDPTNRFELQYRGSDLIAWPVKPVSLPDTKDIQYQFLCFPSEDLKRRIADDPTRPEVREEMMQDSSALVVFDARGERQTLRSFLATEVTITIECREKEIPSEGLDDRYVEVWNEFVRTYHTLTMDVAAPLWDTFEGVIVIKQSWVAYPESAAALQPDARLTAGGDRGSFKRYVIAGATFIPPKVDEVALDAAMRAIFAEGIPVPLSRQTLSGAQRAVSVNRSGKTAVIEAALAMEILVSELVIQHKLSVKDGVSKKKLDEYKKEVGIAYKLNVDLPMILAPMSPEDRQVLAAADAVRKLRNDVVHNTAQPTHEQGEKAVKAVRELFNMLRRHQFKV